MSTSRIVIPKPSEYRRWRFEYWHARTHAYGRREAIAKAGRSLRALRARNSHVEQLPGSQIAQ